MTRSIDVCGLVRRMGLLCVAVFGLAGAGTVLATSANEVEREVEDAMEAIEGYASEQRDDALQSAEDALARLDERIERLERRAESTWAKMTESARAETNEALQALRKRRNAVAEWYGAMKHSTGEAWEDVKRGFSRAYTELSAAVQDAREEF